MKKHLCSVNALIWTSMLKNDSIDEAKSLDTQFMLRRKEILKQHKNSIHQRPDGRWVTKVGSERKKIVKKSRKDLEDAIIYHYLDCGLVPMTFDEIFNEWTDYYKRNHAISSVNRSINDYDIFDREDKEDTFKNLQVY